MGCDARDVPLLHAKADQHLYKTEERRESDLADLPQGPN